MRRPAPSLSDHMNSQAVISTKRLLLLLSERGGTGARWAERGSHHQAGEGQGGQDQGEEGPPGGDAAVAVWPACGAAQPAHEVRPRQEAPQEEEGNG